MQRSRDRPCSRLSDTGEGGQRTAALNIGASSFTVPQTLLIQLSLPYRCVARKLPFKLGASVFFILVRNKSTVYTFLLVAFAVVWHSYSVPL